MLFLFLSFVFSLVSLALSAPVSSVHKRALPEFVYQYAPVFYLHSREKYFPTDLTTFISNTHPENGGGARLSPPVSPLTLANVNTLNALENGGTGVYLTSNEGIQALPTWFQGTRPSADGSLSGSRASAIITVTKPEGIVDAFYFTFFAYNQGNWVLGLPQLEFGDHVGDWEHVMVRFQNGVPAAIWYSQHSGGQAFDYDVVEKRGVRPIAYIAKGSHAIFAKGGDHDHTIPGLNLPGGPLVDETDRGALWDASLGAYEYSFDTGSNSFTAINGGSKEWLDFAGRWGDRQLPDNVKGQVNIFGARKYVGGPTGPRYKDLGRRNVCPGSDNCLILPILIPKE